MKLLKRLNNKLLSLLPEFIPASKRTQEKYRALYYTPHTFLAIWFILGSTLKSVSLLFNALFLAGVGVLILGYLALKEKIDAPYDPGGVIKEQISIVSKTTGREYLYWVIWYSVEGSALIAASLALFLVKSIEALLFLSPTGWPLAREIIMALALSLLNYYGLFALWFQRFFWPKSLSGKFKVYYKKEATIRALLLFILTGAGLILLPITNLIYK